MPAERTHGTGRARVQRCGVHLHHHHHGVAEARTGNRSRMRVALAINLVLLVAGVAGAMLFDSVALLADAGHVLSDVGAIAIGLFAAAMAARPPDVRRTFGYQRTEILAALLNGLALVAVAVLVIVEAIRRLSDPPDVDGIGVLAVGLFGLAGNVAATVALAGGDRRDLNLEGVLRHSAADALGSLGVVAAGAVVAITGWEYADGIAGLAIGLLILLGSWRLVTAPVQVLMEGAPEGMDVHEVGQAMVAVPGVREVHDLHVWTVTSDFPALAAHVLTEPGQNVDDVRERIEQMLHDRFEIEHTTLQVVQDKLVQIEDRRRP
jgi:cobalt-zinc-cadmium efflux system protein